MAKLDDIDRSARAGSLSACLACKRAVKRESDSVVYEFNKDFVN